MHLFVVFFFHARVSSILVLIFFFFPEWTIALVSLKPLILYCFHFSFFRSVSSTFFLLQLYTPSHSTLPFLLSYCFTSPPFLCCEPSFYPILTLQITPLLSCYTIFIIMAVNLHVPLLSLPSLLLPYSTSCVRVVSFTVDLHYSSTYHFSRITGLARTPRISTRFRLIPRPCPSWLILVSLLLFS